MAQFNCNRCKQVYEDHYPADDTCIKCKRGLIQIVTNHPPPKENVMTPIKPTLQLHTREESDNGIYINSLIMKHSGNNYHLYAGTKDTIYIFTESIALYVLTISRENGIIGLNAYMSPEPFPINSFYMHSVPEIIDVFGPKWEQLPALTITMKLINYLM
jgi:hypothetical protein